MQKANQCPYCDFRIEDIWVYVNMMDEIVICPRCKKRIDIRSTKELEKEQENHV